MVWLKPEEEVLLEEVLLMPGQELRLKLELPEQMGTSLRKSPERIDDNWCRRSGFSS